MVRQWDTADDCTLHMQTNQAVCQHSLEITFTNLLVSDCISRVFVTRWILTRVDLAWASVARTCITHLTDASRLHAL